MSDLGKARYAASRGGVSKLLILGLGIWIAVRIARVIAKRLLARLVAVTPPTRASGSERRLMRDPSCGVYVAADPGLALAEVGGTVYFCSAECRDRHRQRRVS